MSDVKTLLLNTVDALYRVAYRMAYPVWQFFGQRFHLRTQGAQVVVWNKGRVLLVRNSYRATYAFPGGYVHRGESTVAAASRELYEETGIVVPAVQLKFATAWSYTHGNLTAHDDIYECRLDLEPSICIDNREVVEARFVTPETGLTLPVESQVHHYLQTRPRWS